MKVNDLKLYKNTAIVDFGDQQVTLELEVVFKYNIKVGTEILLSKFVEICNESDERYGYRIAFSCLKHKLTVCELRQALSRHEIKEYIINKIINDLIQRKYLNDLEYALYVFEMKKSSKGIIEIESILSCKGISSAIIDIIKTKYNASDEIDNFIDKYLKRTHNKPKKTLIASLKKYLYGLGFDEELIEHKVENREGSIYIDESSLIRKELVKLKKEQINNSSSSKSIKSKLYQKGYSQKSIMEVLDEINDK